MQNKRKWAMIFVSIVWIFYIVKFSYKELMIWEYRGISTLSTIAVLMIISTSIINRKTHDKYFFVSFLSLIIYSIWIINLDLSSRGLSSIPTVFSILTPIIVVGINYGYEKIKKNESVSIIKSLCISVLLGILSYVITFASILIFFLVY
jgi:hypothetical protein